MQVSRELALKVTAEIMKAVEKIFEANGLAKPEPYTKYGFAYTLKLESSLLTKGENGVNTTSREAIAYQGFVSLDGLDPDAVGKKYTLRGEEYVFIGVADKSFKYPFLFQRTSDGKTYKFTTPEAEAVLKLSQPTDVKK